MDWEEKNIMIPGLLYSERMPSGKLLSIWLREIADDCIQERGRDIGTG